MLYHENFQKNLLSEIALQRSGYLVTMNEKDEVGTKKIVKDEEVIFETRELYNLFRIQVSNIIKNDEEEEINLINDIDTWHQRFAHLNYKSIQNMKKKEIVK